jgi:divalent metal cation (Fe/Co/Zn/Cd) transporter
VDAWCSSVASVSSLDREAPACPRDGERRSLWLSIAAALATITLKVAAWALTGSVGVLSDAVESVINLAAAAFALVIVHWDARPPDEEHP